MSYQTYTTKAIVCGSRSNNTSDKSLLLFTREAGMLWASARSVREERSKQRFSLQDFSLVKVSLIKGKTGWKIGSIECEKNFFTLSTTQSARITVINVVKLTRQFIQGEAYQPQLFDDFKSVLDQSVIKEGKHLVAIYTLRLLHNLGYIATENSFENYLATAEWWTLPPLPATAEIAISRAKDVSHL